MYYFILFVIVSIFFLLIPSKKISLKVVSFKNLIFPLVVVVFLISIVILSKPAFDSSHKGFMLWVNNVIPSLFPFLVGIELLKSTNFMKVLGKLLEPIMRPLFNVPGCGAFALAMGISSGYPVGAKITADLREQKLCTKHEAERLLAFTNTSGPLFIVGAVGVGMFADSRIGFLLLLTHFLSAITVGLLFKYYKKNTISSQTVSIISQKEKIENKNSPFTFNKLGYIVGEAIKNSMNTLLLIGGYIIFFSVLNTVLTNTHILDYFSLFIRQILEIFHFSTDMASSALTGILEVTNGVNLISAFTHVTYLEKITVIAFILGFGGFSVHMQVSSIVAETDISMKPYLFGKLLQGIFASIYTYLLMKYTTFFSWDIVQTFSYSISQSNTNNPIYLGIVTITTLFLIGIFYKICQIPLLKKS